MMTKSQREAAIAEARKHKITAANLAAIKNDIDAAQSLEVNVTKEKLKAMVHVKDEDIAKLDELGQIPLVGEKTFAQTDLDGAAGIYRLPGYG
jgi:hypothetical protein